MDADLNEADLAAMFVAKKKKKKKVVVDDETAAAQEEPDDTYDDLLARLYKTMGVLQDAGSGVKVQRPRMEKIGSKKSAWLNFRATCETLTRAEDHISTFMSSETGTLVSVTQDGALLFRGNFVANKIESCIRKYMENYVKCPMCMSTQTVLKRDSDTRLMMLECGKCRAIRSVENISTGFHATTKADRKKEKEHE